jgi:CheY-like chemotaxis protein
MTLDRSLLDAFVPEFEAEAARLSLAADPPAAARALDQLRAMAAALGTPGLGTLTERAAALLDPLDLPALRAAAEGLACHARAIAEAGTDLPPPEPLSAAPQPAAVPPAPVAAPLDTELLAAFLPEFEAGCDRLAAAADPAAALRAAAALDAMAASLGLGSLRGPLGGIPPDPFDATALPPLAEAMRRHARGIAAAGHDLPLPAPARRRVLVVDDSAMMRRLVREILGGDDAFEVVGEAADGRAALAAMADLKPDLTMLDIEMPELDGIGVLRAWSLRGPGAVVVVSSAARPGSATAIAARGLGAAGIVGKPSGALSPDLRQRQGEALLRTARRAAGITT